jgi:site-specific DNA recombinase
VADNHGLTDAMRDSFSKQLDKLEAQEDYFLDLAAEEEWPKEKLRGKINKIRAERKTIRRQLEQSEGQLDTGKAIFYRALDLLDDPEPMYRRGDEVVRSLLNKTFFTRLYVDGYKVVADDRREPFGVIGEAYKLYRQQRRGGRSYSRRVGSLTQEAAAPLVEYGGSDTSSLTDALALASEGQGSNTTVLVGAAGIEPATPCL